MNSNVTISLPARLSADDIPDLAARWVQPTKRQMFLIAYLASIAAAETPQERTALEVNAAIIDQSGLWEHVDPEGLALAINFTTHPQRVLSFLLSGLASRSLAAEVEDRLIVTKAVSIYDGDIVKEISEKRPSRNTPIFARGLLRKTIKKRFQHLNLSRLGPANASRSSIIEAEIDDSLFIIEIEEGMFEETITDYTSAENLKVPKSLKGSGDG